MRLFENPEFVLGVASLDQLPPADRPEIAFAGRSNVGKSSLLNALTGRKNLARTSHTPGRTQQLNVFDMAGRFYLVDMPGYGYARVAKKQRNAWQDLINGYLKGRPNLRCVFLLVDARHGLKESDRAMMRMLDEAGVSYRLVFTKVDKVHENELKPRIDKTKQNLKDHPAAFPDILPTSAFKDTGIDELRETVAGVVV